MVPGLSRLLLHSPLLPLLYSPQLVLSPPCLCLGLSFQVVQPKWSRKLWSLMGQWLERPRALHSPLPFRSSPTFPLPRGSAFLHGPFLSGGGRAIEQRSSPAAGTLRSIAAHCVLWGWFLSLVLSSPPRGLFGLASFVGCPDLLWGGSG